MSEAVPCLDLRPDHWAIVCEILRRYVPDRKVLAFGSRATWTAKEHSDLDLAILGDAPLSLEETSALAESFTESDLPFKVDLVDWTKIDETFRSIIRRGGVAVLFPARNSETSCPEQRSVPTSRKLSVESDHNEDTTTRGWLFHPVFPAHWRSCSLYSMATWVNGIAFKNIQFSETGRPVIKIAEIKGGISGQTKFTRQTFGESVFVGSGDLLFSWSGQPETSIDAFWWRGPEGWLNQHIFKVTPDARIDTIFFYYLLRYLKPNFVAIARNKQTTGLGHVTRRDLENLAVAYPSPPEQRAIAHILGTLDDKIELNRRMNETLEAMVRALFKSWFVDFGPVRAKMEGCDTGLPRHIADLFPDRLVDSELGKIPEGWKVAELEDCLKLAYGKSLPAKHRKPGSVAVYGSGGVTGTHDAPLVEGPVVIVGRKDTVGSLFWEDGPAFPIDTVFYVVPRIGSMLFCYQLLAAQPLSDMNTDAAVPGLNRGNAYRLQFPRPTTELISAFDDVAGPLWTRRATNQKEAKVQTHIRDLLLPKLISGDIRLRDTERLMGEVA